LHVPKTMGGGTPSVSILNASRAGPRESASGARASAVREAVVPLRSGRERPRRPVHLTSKYEPRECSRRMDSAAARDNPDHRVTLPSTMPSALQTGLISPYEIQHRENSSNPGTVGRNWFKSPRWFLPNWPVAYPIDFNVVAMVGASTGMPSVEPACPTVVSPVRIGNSPVMKFARAAVQLASA